MDTLKIWTFTVEDRSGWYTRMSRRVYVIAKDEDSAERFLHNTYNPKNWDYKFSHSSTIIGGEVLSGGSF